LWTPGGEHRVPPPSGSGDSPDSPPPSPPPSRPPRDRSPRDEDEPSPEEVQRAHEELEELRSRLASAPAEAVLANHCYGIFELAALHLSQQVPNLDAARLAIDALAALLDGLKGRLGEEEPSLVEGLAQLRLAWVQLQAATAAATGEDG
jgi:hypothetical protein